MKVLVLTTNTVNMACPRFRIHQYIPLLREHGVHLDIRPFLTPKIEELLYQKGRLHEKTSGLLLAACRRLADLPAAVNADLVYVLREACLIGPAIVEWFARRVARKPLVFDLDDPLWERYDSPTHGRLAMLLKMPEKTMTLFRLASRIVAGNEYVAAFARRFNPRTSIIPTVVDTDIFREPSRREVERIPTIGWVGSHSTLQHLEPILPALAQAARQVRFRLQITGAGREIAMPSVEVRNQAWRLESEVESFQSIDIGLYPLTEDSWSIGKSAFKAVQYGACGVPCIGSPVGAVSSMIQHGRTGLLAESLQAWIDAVVTLVKSPELRLSMGAEARKMVESHYSLRVWAPVLADLLHRTLKENAQENDNS